jgi:hypothetical protein
MYQGRHFILGRSTTTGDINKVIYMDSEWLLVRLRFPIELCRRSAILHYDHRYGHNHRCWYMSSYPIHSGWYSKCSASHLNQGCSGFFITIVSEDSPIESPETRLNARDRLVRMVHSSLSCRVMLNIRRVATADTNSAAQSTTYEMSSRSEARSRARSSMQFVGRAVRSVDSA